MNFAHWKIIYLSLAVVAAMMPLLSLLTDDGPLLSALGVVGYLTTLVAWIGIWEYNRRQPYGRQIAMVKRLLVVILVALPVAPWEFRTEEAVQLFGRTDADAITQVFVGVMVVASMAYVVWMLAVAFQIYRKWSGSKVVMKQYLVLVVAYNVVSSLLNLLAEGAWVMVVDRCLDAAYFFVYYYIAYLVCRRKTLTQNC